MDKLKPVLQSLSKHLFWIGCVLVLLISTGSWFTARSSLHKEFDENLTKIKGSFQSANTLKTKANPPNEHSNAQMDKLTDNAHKLVTEAWRKQYSHQENILRWSTELREDFIAAVRPLKPIEVKVDFPPLPHQELKVDHRQRYANYVERLLPKLAEVVGSKWVAGKNVAPVAKPAVVPGQPPATVPVEQPLVVWDAQDQARLLAAHFDWSKQPDSAPTTLQVLYAQEDLWVLTALMWIINKTNGDAETRHEAVVKTINSVMIGRSAMGRAGDIVRLGGMTAGGAGGEMGMGEYGSESGMDPSSEGGMPSMDPMSSGMGMDPESGGMGMGRGAMGDPANFRYVDNDYKPLPATRVREAMRSGSPEDAFLVVAKRMPIRLRLVVDQRKLHRLLAECGNSALPVEIRQVRVNRTGTSSGSGYSGMAGGYAGGYGGDSSSSYGSMPGGYGGESYSSESYSSESYSSESYSSESYGGYGPGSESYGGYDAGGYGGGGYGGGGYGGGGYGGGGYGTGGTPQNLRERTEVSSTTSYDVPVEVYGIIYIYNPVDENKLGTEQSPALTGTMASEAPAAG